MIKNVLKKVLVIAIVAIVIMFVNSPVLHAEDGQKASGISSFSGKEAIKEWSDAAMEEKDSDSANTSKKIIGAALNITQIVAVAILLIMAIVLALKYMVSSIDDRAEIKKHMITYFIGAILIISAVGIVGLIYKFSSAIQ